MKTSPHGHPFSRSYGVILPSSLRRVISSAFPYSGYLPVSGYGTNSHGTLVRIFLGSVASMTSPLAYLRLPITSYPAAVRRSYGFGRRHPTLRSPSLLRPLTMITSIAGSGILTGYPSPTLCGLGLGSTNPGWINLPQETLDFRRTGFSPVFSLLIPTYSLLSAPVFLTVHLRRVTERSPTPSLK